MWLGGRVYRGGGKNWSRAGMRWTDIGVIYSLSGKEVGVGEIDSRGDKKEELLQIMISRNQEED